MQATKGRVYLRLLTPSGPSRLNLVRGLTARYFYCDALGLAELHEPSKLALRGGAWFTPLRIAFSGAHATGKTTLIAELRYQLGQYESVEEPYCALLEEGHQFADTPSAEDLEVQLARSIAATRERRDNNVLFDRSPADYLAYLYALRGSSRPALDAWIQPTIEALRTLKLVVFVPVERPDRISDTEFPRLRRRVDSILREIWIEDDWGFGANALEVTGPIPERASQVLAYLARTVRADNRL